MELFTPPLLFFNNFFGPNYVLGVLQGLVCPYLNPHLYHGLAVEELTPPPVFFLVLLFLLFVFALFESSLLQSSWGGLPSSLFQSSWGGLPPRLRFYRD